MYHVWDGSQWNSQKALKVWSGSAWVKNYKFKVRTSISWLPSSVSDKDASQIIKWSVAAPTPPPPPPPVTHAVPDLDLMTDTQLDAALTPLNFGYTIAGYEDTPILDRDNKVVIDSQIPPANQQMAEGLDVSVRLYNFVQPTTTVPNLDLLLSSVANSNITAANLVVGTPIEEEKTTDPNLFGKVKVGSQYPPANDVVDTGTSVTYTKWIEEDKVAIPNTLTGVDFYEMQSRLTTAGLEIGTEITPGFETDAGPTGTAQEGLVYSTFPTAGTQVYIGSQVNYRLRIPNTRTKIPNVVGMSPYNAQVELENWDLIYFEYIIQEGGPSAQDNTVIAQQPAANASLTATAVGTQINLTIQIPNTTTFVPNIVGDTVSVATAECTTAELILNPNGPTLTATETSNTALHGKVASQDPSANTSQPVYSWVNYGVYTPISNVLVPDLQYQIPGAYGTTISVEPLLKWGSLIATYETTDTNLQGKVVSTSPANGTSVPVNSYVSYYKWVAPVLKTVPNVVGQTQANAQNMITAAGLNYTVTTKNQTYNGQATAGTVESQSPTSGQVAAGSNVAIVVWNAYVPILVTRYATKTLFTGALRSYTSAGTSLSTTYAYHGTFNSTTNTNCFALVNVPYSFTEQNLQGFQLLAARYYFYQDHTYSAGTPVTVYVGTHNQSSIPSSITRSNGIVTTGNVNKTVSRSDFTYVTLSATQRAAIWGGPAYGLSIYAQSSTATGSNYGYHTPNWVEVDYSYTEWQ